MTITRKLFTEPGTFAALYSGFNSAAAFSMLVGAVHWLSFCSAKRAALCLSPAVEPARKAPDSESSPAPSKAEGPQSLGEAQAGSRQQAAMGGAQDQGSGAPESASSSAQAHGKSHHSHADEGNVDGGCVRGGVVHEQLHE